MVDLIAIDAGNTTFGVGLIADGKLVRKGSFRHGDTGSEALLEEFLDAVPSGVPVAIAGVHPEAMNRLARALGRVRPVKMAPEQFRAPIENCCIPPESVGIDRLLNAAAAALDGTPVVVVDAGTAITVDWIDEDRCFRGGAIAPGVRVSLAALHSQTRRLPLVEAKASQSIPTRGTDTEDAILCGVVRGLAGLVDRLVDEVAGGQPARVALAGGDGPLLLPLLRCRPRYDADLTLRGIACGVASSS